MSKTLVQRPPPGPQKDVFTGCLTGSSAGRHAGLVPRASPTILAAMPSRSRAPIPAAPPPTTHDDEELELPPLDGVLDDEEPAGGGGHDDEIDEAPLLGDDDGAAFDLDPAAEIDAIDEHAAEGSDAAHDAVDVGSLADAIALPDEGPRATDEHGLAHEEHDASPFDTQTSDEAGAGTGEDLAAFVDEGALPPLGANDGDELAPGAHLAQAGRASRWDRGRYHLATGLGAEVPCRLLAVSASHVVAAGPAVLVVRDGARMSRGGDPDIDAVAVAAMDGAIFAASRRGALFASTDGGDTWAPAGTLHPSAPPIELAATPGRLWIRQQGALWSTRWSEGGAEPQVLVRKEGVRAMAAAGSSLVILAEREGHLAIERLRGDDEASAPEPLPEAMTAAAEGASMPAAGDGGRALVLLAGGVAHVSRDGGRSFRVCHTGPALAASFVGTGPGARLLLLTRSERAGIAAAFVLEIDEAGTETRVAEIAAGGEGAAAIVWDPTREALWVACDAGLLAFQRSAKH